MATQTELALEEARARVTYLETKAAQEAALRQSASVNMRALTIQLHNTMCEDSHPDKCDWPNDPNANDAEQADWTVGGHARWLNFVAFAMDRARAAGWTVTEPTP